MTRPAPRPSKYRAVKTQCQHGHIHDSAKEARVCNDLHIRQRAGEITHLEVQPRFRIVIEGEPLRIRSDGYPNGRAVAYTADFAFNDHAEQPPRRRVLDAKGLDLPRSRLLRALAEHVYHFRVELV